jgi:uncharacterized membrane protein YdjX (TVP38/TMEM64 family)
MIRTSAIETSSSRRPPWTWIALGLLLVAVSVGWFFVPRSQWLDAFQRWITGLGIWGVALFTLIYVLATISLAPEWPLTIAAGLVYGARGFPVVLIAATIAASLAFLIARHLARDRVQPILERSRIFAAIDDAVAEEGWKIVALLRLSPAVPFNLQNYLFGVTAVPFLHFVAATFAGIIPGTVLYVYLGVIGKAAGSKGSSGGPLKWAWFSAGLLATVVVVVLVTRKAITKLKEAGVDGGNRDAPTGN